MFDKLMNSYYYGKSGKGDYTPDDLPKNRWQLFMEMLRTRMSGLCRMNLMYFVAWLPAMIAISLWVVSFGVALNNSFPVDEAGNIIEEVAANGVQSFWQTLNDMNFMTLLILIPCIAITGPFTAGLSYVTRNWARDEHAFPWADYKDAIKANWKQGLLVSTITGCVPFLVYICWRFYGDMAVGNAVWVIPQMLILMLGILWALAVTYMYPMMVTYQMNFRTIIRNSFILAVGRLPGSVGIRLLHCVPTVLFTVIFLLTLQPWVLMLLFAYYLIFGFAFSRFITASFTNAVFDKYINSRIEGAQVNRGLSQENDDDDDDDEQEEERELKPWENGYTDKR
ncbi:MAG TPA: DUF624 domain-containing protein [Clostridiales bacterium]|nr:DUF624 domain-containing protein [Clostridiales bacterium]